jgi:Fe-S cluster assembly protein SufD
MLNMDVREGLLRPDLMNSGMEEAGVKGSSYGLVIHERHFAKYDYWFWDFYGITRPAFVLDDIGGPQWLQARRSDALARADHLPLPSVEAEEWRYSRIAELDLERYSAAPSRSDGPGTVGIPTAVGGVLADVGPLSGIVVLLDGRVIHSEVEGEPWDAGVRFGSSYDDAVGADAVLGEAVLAPADLFVAWNDALSVEPVVLDVPAGVTVTRPFAVVSYVVVPQQQRQGGATLDVGVAALGGDYARLRLDCRLDGKGATGNLSSVYLGDGDQMLDLRTFQSHNAPNTTSNLLFKGGVADTAHSVYTGLIRIAPGAKGSNAFQTNRNIKLSDGAWAESVPNLEIENNDVHCSHASTVGPVDSDQRFYLESRGVPTNVAERLVVGGFFDEVLDDFAVPALAGQVAARLDGTLDRALGQTSSANAAEAS